MTLGQADREQSIAVMTAQGATAEEIAALFGEAPKPRRGKRD